MNFLVDFDQYAVIGDPIEHSISPFLHRIIFDYFNEKNKIYSKFKITPDGLVYNFSLLKSNFKGFNVTSPHKGSIIKYLDSVDEFVDMIKVSNTVKILNGKTIGYNTDIYGFSKGLGKYKDLIEGKEILVLGVGATSKVITSLLIELGAFVTISGRNNEKVTQFKKSINDIYEGYDLKAVNIEKINKEYFGIVNATSVSFSKGNFNIKLCDSLEFIYDINYSLYEDVFPGDLKVQGISLIDGFDMLFYQAIASQEIWRDKKISENEQQELYSIFKKFILEA